MGAIRAGGLASGLDTNGIIEKLVENAKEPIYRLDNKYHLLTLEKTTYKDISSDLTAMKNNIFNLKLESTFKSKTISSSNTSIASAKATSAAAKGTHTIEVLQTARNASVTSTFTTLSVTEKGAGVKTISSTAPLYDQLEGTYTTTVSTNTALNKSVAISTFKAGNNKTFFQYSTNIAMDNTLVNDNGEILITASASESVGFTINMGSGAISLPAISMDPSKYSDIQSLMAHLESTLNDLINEQMGSFNKQYVALRADYYNDNGTGKWITSAYNVSDEVFSIGTTGAGTLGDKLGLNGSTMYYLETKEIAKYIVADNHLALQGKMSARYSSGNDYDILCGLIPGTIINFESTGLKDGTFEIIQDGSMNVKKATKTTVTGAAFTNSTVSLTNKIPNSGLSLAGLNGKFTINGIEIKIDDYTQLSFNDLMGIVNSSGAGVTMSYDSTTNQFKLVSNQTGASTVTLGASSDTSSFFDSLKLSAVKGAVKTSGTTAGTISATSIISQAGFTTAIGAGVFTINNVPIYIDNTKDTVQDMMDKINRSGAGVTITYDSIRDKFMITSDSAERVRFGSTTDTSNALAVMGFLANYNTPSEMGSAGQNAIVRIDGQTYNRSTNIIDDVLTGVTITATSLGTTTIEIDVDIDKAVTALATFIKSYNSLMVKLRPEEISREDRKNKMDALTTAKKESMSDDDIKNYEEEYDALHTTDIILKSKEIKNLAKDLRANIMSQVPTSTSIYKTLSSMGIDIAGAGDISISQKGYLVAASTDLETIKDTILGNSTLMGNLRNNSDEVYKFFASYEEETVYIDTTTGKEATSTSLKKDVVSKTITIHDSWSRRYEKLLTAYLDIEGQIGIKTRVDGALDKQMTRIAKEIERQQQRAEDYLELLWSQFTNMETRIAAIQSQSQYIAQLANSASGSSK